MAIYKGTFHALDSTSAVTAGTQYSVYLGDSGEEVEILLSGSQPFVVKYNESKTPFDPVRTSTATIKIVHNNYMEDILSPYAQGTSVRLVNETLNVLEWTGFLTPKLYNQSYENEYEEIELEAADCISSLQYINYTDDPEYAPQIVTFAQIMAKICDNCKLLGGYYWTASKNINGNLLTPDLVKISEANFFTNDTEESWTLLDLLEEICKYFGFTALQWKDRMCLVDYQYYHSNNSLNAIWYSKQSGYQRGGSEWLGHQRQILKKDYRKSGASISFEPVYNQCTVKDNFFTCEDFIPNIFDDSYLVNRLDADDFYKSYEVPAEEPYNPLYLRGKWREDGDKESTYKGDNKYRYFHRLYDHKNWESCYPNGKDADETKVLRNNLGATIVDLGVVERAYLDDYGQYQIPNKLDYTRYICINQRGTGGWDLVDETPIFKLKSGFKSNVFLGDDSFLVLNFNVLFERYDYRPYINPDWNNELLNNGGASNYYKDPVMCFKLKIGNKYWNGEEWLTTELPFKILPERTENNVGSWNQEKKTLNNISWEEFVDAEGYKIPLAGIDTTQDVQFEILLPLLQYTSGDPYTGDKHWNQYCWIKDFSLKCVQKGQDMERQENDVIYQAVIDEDAVNDIGDIELKLTTYTDLTNPSYSNVIAVSGTSNVLLETIYESNIADEAQKPEENIIEKYIQQYNSPTKSITATLKMDITPFDKIVGIDVDSPTTGYVQLGTEIDYAMAAQTITMIEKK